VVVRVEVGSISHDLFHAKALSMAKAQTTSPRLRRPQK
jgi:hypothetical protein